MALKDIAKTMTIVINVVFAVMGIVVLSMAAYGLAKFSDFEDLVSKGGLTLTLLVGVFILCLSGMGIFGAKKQNKVVLLVYTGLLGVLIILQLVGGALMAAWMGKISDVRESSLGEFGSDAVDNAMFHMDNLVNCTFNECCVEEDGFDMVKCDSETYEIAPLVCKSVLGVDGVDIINDHNCKSETAWREAILGWAEGNMQSISIAAIVLAVVELAAFVFSVYLMCTHKDQFFEARV
jgi:hypothetical protein